MRRSSDSFAVTSTVISAAASVSIASKKASSVDITTVQTLIDTTLNRIANTFFEAQGRYCSIQVQNHGKKHI